MATRTDVTVCIPWRPTPTRVAPYERVRKFWEYAGFSVITDPGDPDPANPFNISKARNNMVKAADTDLVIICDADTLPPLHAIDQALADPTGVIHPGSESRVIHHSWVNKTDLFAAPLVASAVNPAGCVFVLSRELYWRLGGMDERFIGWGGEDVAFNAVARTLSQVRNLPGTMFAFNHQAARKESEETRLLYRRYLAAMGSDWRMRMLLDNRQ